MWTDELDPIFTLNEFKISIRTKRITQMQLKVTYLYSRIVIQNLLERENTIKSVAQIITLTQQEKSKE